MMSDIAKDVLHDFEELFNEDKDHLLIWLENHYGKKIMLSLDDLSAMDLKDIKTIKSIIRGMILTRKHVPDILTVYEKLKEENLKYFPSRVSFGRINQSEIDKD
jgi:hypothetical protein